MCVCVCVCVCVYLGSESLFKACSVEDSGVFCF